jgi:hypothetical protein
MGFGGISVSFTFTHGFENAWMMFSTFCWGASKPW